MKDTSKELYLLFYKFSRWVDKSENTFCFDSVLFKIENALEVIKEENQHIASFYNLQVTSTLPNLIHGEKTWFEFVVRKLILNGINRQSDLSTPVEVKL
jgi:hypothetical protein